MRSNNRVGPPLRNSVRSRGSSSTTYSDDPRQKVRDCCRKTIAFMCTQVGVGGLIIGYAVLGAIGFKTISPGGDGKYVKDMVKELFTNCSHDLWELTADENVFNETAWRIRVDKVLLNFQSNIAEAVKQGYTKLNAPKDWTFTEALMYSLSVFTMLGYGNMVPRTTAGKILTVVYAVFGIPLYVLYFLNMGKVLAQTFRWVYTKMYECSMEDRRRGSLEDGPVQPNPRIIVPSTACLWVMVCYVAAGSAMYSNWENWGILDSVYFCVTSLCKIGFGDLVPGIDTHNDQDEIKLMFNFVYILLGMGLLAMCYNLTSEVIRVKMRNLKADIGFCFEDIRLRAVAYYRRRNSLDS